MSIRPVSCCPAAAMQSQPEFVKCAEVLPGLYLGSLNSLQSIKALGITHVLSMTDFIVRDHMRHTWPEHMADFEACKHLRIRLADLLEADLLGSLPAALAFISDALSTAGSRVLVHCLAGVSRSASVVIAHIMKEQGLDVQQALEYVKERRPVVHPNPGFVKQLHLFHSTGCSTDLSHPVYHMWRLQLASKEVTQRGRVDNTILGHMPQEWGATADQVGQHNMYTYRCAACSAPLATAKHLLTAQHLAASHTVHALCKRMWVVRWTWEELKRDGKPADIGTSQTKDPASGAAPCPAGKEASALPDDDDWLYFTPLDWMVDISSTYTYESGSLHCPSCQACLGQFNWEGAETRDHQWVVPAFQLRRSLVTQAPSMEAPLPGSGQELPGAATAGGLQAPASQPVAA